VLWQQYIERVYVVYLVAHCATRYTTIVRILKFWF